MSEDTAEFETVLDLYRNRQRRVVLAVLADEQRPLTLNDLTKTIIRYAHEAPVTEVPEDAVRRIRISLHHVHLPKVADAGLVEYDSERKRAEPTERLDKVYPHLSTLLAADPELEDPFEL